MVAGSAAGMCLTSLFCLFSSSICCSRALSELVMGFCAFGSLHSDMKRPIFSGEAPPYDGAFSGCSLSEKRNFRASDVVRSERRWSVTAGSGTRTLRLATKLVELWPNASLAGRKGRDGTTCWSSLEGYVCGCAPPGARMSGMKWISWTSASVP